MIRILGLCSYPVESAATRFRLAQYVEPLAEAGIELDVSPFLDGRQFSNLYTHGNVAAKLSGLIWPLLKRAMLIRKVREYDLIFVQREAILFGPALFESLYRRIGRIPMVLDLDDATYVHYLSPSYRRLGTYLKFFGKTDKLIDESAVVTCGNRFIADYVRSKGGKAVVLPTVVNTDEFKPVTKEDNVPVIGWIGTHSTFPFLEWLFPVLERLATKHRFVLKVVGSGRPEISLKGIETISLPWELSTEVGHFQSLDIGLYPMTLSSSASREWLLGKSGFKAIQYMAVGTPFVMSPIGVASELGEPGVTHFNAESAEDWYTRLEQLLLDPSLRATMGRAGRQHSLENFTVQSQAKLLAKTLKEACVKISV